MQPMPEIKVLSLFDGIATARYALDQLGIPVHYYASEVDKYAIRIATKNYPDIIQLGDIRQIKAKDLPKVDLLIGGFPCQDLSIAKNNRQGLKGERSGLFYEMLRLHKETKPKYFVYENVASMAKDQKELITKEISAVAGYRVEPIMINAALVSAQNRKRLFWTNIEVPQPEDRGILLKDILENATTETPKARTIDANYHKAGLYKVPVALRNRGNGKQPEYNGTNKANSLTTVQTDSMVQEETIIRKLTTIECERLQSLPDNYTEGVSNTQRYKALGNAFNAKVIKHILTYAHMDRGSDPQR